MLIDTRQEKGQRKSQSIKSQYIHTPFISMESMCRHYSDYLILFLKACKHHVKCSTRP